MVLRFPACGLISHVPLLSEDALGPGPRLLLAQGLAHGRARNCVSGYGHCSHCIARGHSHITCLLCSHTLVLVLPDQLLLRSQQHPNSSLQHKLPHLPKLIASQDTLTPGFSILPLIHPTQAQFSENFSHMPVALTPFPNPLPWTV